MLGSKTLISFTTSCVFSPGEVELSKASEVSSDFSSDAAA